jgi:hypothetical protein
MQLLVKQFKVIPRAAFEILVYLVKVLIIAPSG